MISLLNDTESDLDTTPIPGSLRGLWVVTTPVGPKQLRVGDVVRVLVSTEGGVGLGYLMSRASDPLWTRDLPRADKQAKVRNICEWVPMAHLCVLDMPRCLPRASENGDMEPFLTKSPHLVPDGGWARFLEGAGVMGAFKPPSSWQFSARCWDKRLVTGKTGGLHVTMNPDSSRRCQLSVEVGVCGDSLVDTISGSRAGILMYLPNMSVMANAPQQDVCYDSTKTIAFSALLILYAEALSIVRKEVYTTPHHPMGGQPYPCMEWDFAHVPFSKPWTVSTSSKNKHTVDIHEYARERARAWVRAEMVASPESWKPAPTNPHTTTTTSGPVYAMTSKRGVNRWVRASNPQPGSLCYQNDRMFYI